MDDHWSLAVSFTPYLVYYRSPGSIFLFSLLLDYKIARMHRYDLPEVVWHLKSLVLNVLLSFPPCRHLCSAYFAFTLSLDAVFLRT